MPTAAHAKPLATATGEGKLKPFQVPGTQPWWRDWCRVRDSVFNVLLKYPDIHKEVMDSMRRSGVLDG